MDDKNKNEIGDVDALTTDNARLRERVQDLSNYIDGRKAQWEALTARLFRERQTIADLETAIGVRDARIAGFARTAARLEQRLEGQRREIAMLRERLTRSGTRGGAGRSANADDEARVILRAAYDKLASMRAEQTRLKTQLEDRNACIDRLCAKLSELELERRQTAGTLRRQRRMVDHIENEIRSRLTRLASASRDAQRRREASATIHRLAERRALLEGDRADQNAPAGIGARLTLLNEADPPVQYEVGARTLTIGRGLQNDIRIQRQSVSREHARLTPADGGIVIEDLCSRNGVRINGRPVARERLRSGDVISIGRVQFRFSQSILPFNRHNAS